MKTSLLLSCLLLGSLATACVDDADPDDADQLGASQSALDVFNRRIKSAINTAGDGKCLDVASGQTSAGTPIVQFRCHSGGNQRFSIQQITFGGTHIISTDLAPSMCVGIDDNSFANPNKLVTLVPCRVAGDVPLGARWRLDTVNGHTRFRHQLLSSAGHSVCLDVASGLNWDSLWMQVYDCNGGSNQQWDIL